MKTICIYHSRDLDGWMSAAIVQKWWRESDPQGTVYIDPKTRALAKEGGNVLVFKGWDYGDEIPDLSDYNRVIMVDVSFSRSEMMNICVKDGTPLIWIDHHISAIKENGFTTTFEDQDKVYIEGIRDIDFAACELTWMYFFDKKESDKMPEMVRLLGRYDCFGHKGTDEEQKVLEFQYAARASMSSYEECFEYLNRDINESYLTDRMHETGKSIYAYLCTEAKQTYAKAFRVEFKLSKSGLAKDEKGMAYPIYYKFLCVNQERFNPINFGIDYHKEGYDGFACFWLKDDKWTFSLYNDNGKVDCSAICKQHGGGGHKGAAGFVCSFDELKQIIS